MRRTREYRIEAPTDGSENRDVGKTFLITEMSATDGEAWAMRAMGAMMRAGMPIDEEVMAGGLAAMSMLGIKALMSAPFDVVKPLMQEMMSCVQIKEDLVTRPLLETDIEEIGTRIRLRDEVVALHLGFSPAVVMLTAAALAQEAAALSSNTRTSTPGSGPSSGRGSRRSGNSKTRSAQKT